MLYLILMNPDENKNSLYKGAITILGGKPWYVTSLARPTIFKTQREVKNMVVKLMKWNPDREFIEVTVEFYLSLVGKSLDKWSNSWINQLRQEQLEL